MDENAVTFNLPNLITFMIMALVGFAALGFVSRAAREAMAGSQAASE
jgi:hypothetical protein